jgi:hypothetical protein
MSIPQQPLPLQAANSTATGNPTAATATGGKGNRGQPQSSGNLPKWHFRVLMLSGDESFNIWAQSALFYFFKFCSILIFFS